MKSLPKDPKPSINTQKTTTSIIKDPERRKKIIAEMIELIEKNQKLQDEINNALKKDK